MKRVLLGFLCLLAFAMKAQVKVIHVLVALCDNKNQGIVPVPAKIGNGQDPKNNLYWGCGYGVKSFFKKQSEWKLIKDSVGLPNNILERVVFKHATLPVYLVADAYDGAYIKQTTKDLIDFSAGLRKDTLILGKVKLGIGGAAQLICYTGHDGLMDFTLDQTPAQNDKATRETIILACYSKSYFSAAIRKAGAQPLLWSTHLMSPEAYTLHAAITGWLAHETPGQVRERAAQAYHKYLKCGLKGARNLLVTGF
ncbi:MAG: hypothetical protein JST26_06670 [Bacteroidetes bacterium]|nr:hypothetical protein [Bacteroidota bacterium]